LVAAGAADVEYVGLYYVVNPAGISCTLAEDDNGNLLGFQSLARVALGNPEDTPLGWGIIGTNVSPDAAELLALGAAIPLERDPLPQHRRNSEPFLRQAYQ
jgi:hypothetical protein